MGGKTEQARAYLPLPQQVPVAERARRARARGAREVVRLQVPPLQQPLRGEARHGALQSRREHQCPHCTSRFGTVSNMRAHCKTVHEKVRAHASPTVMASPSGNMHIDTVHLKLRDHACPDCEGVAFGCKSDLTRYLDTVHFEQREHGCPYCPGVASQTKQHLKTHIKTVHEKRRDHVCGYCQGVAFGTAGHLKRHIDVVHLKIKRSRGAK